MGWGALKEPTGRDSAEGELGSSKRSSLHKRFGDQ